MRPKGRQRLRDGPGRVGSAITRVSGRAFASSTPAQSRAYVIKGEVGAQRAPGGGRGDLAQVRPEAPEPTRRRPKVSASQVAGSGPTRARLGVTRRGGRGAKRLPLNGRGAEEKGGAPATALSSRRGARSNRCSLGSSSRRCGARPRSEGGRVLRIARGFEARRALGSEQRSREPRRARSSGAARLVR